MELKVVCKTCKGLGGKSIGQGGVFKECPECNGKGYTNPPQQILDDLECAEIERYLVNKNCKYEYTYCKYNIKNQHVISFNENVQSEVSYIREKTKLGALKKAKQLIEGRG